MTPLPPRLEPPVLSRPQTLAAPGTIDSQTLLAGRRELIIQHGDDQYRLRLTAQNKLILTK